MRSITLSCFIAFTGLTILICLAMPCTARTGKLKNISWQKTMEQYRDVPCLTEEELQYGSEVIAGLGYNSSRAFRRLCQMEGINFSKSIEAWSWLISQNLSYEQLLAFEDWSDLSTIDIDLGLKALTAISSLSYEAGIAFRNYCKLPRVTPEHALQAVSLLSRLNDAQSRALSQMLSLTGISAEQALDGLGSIARLSYYQALALEALEKIPGMTIETTLDTMPLVRMLSMESSWNVKTLFTLQPLSPEKAWYWLVTFFANPTDIREKQFQTFTAHEKELLIRAFDYGGDELIWKINNLHGVTDRFGYEISNQTLSEYSTKKRGELFEKLSPQIQSDFANQFYSATGKKQINTLKQAIKAERKATARRLTSANIYALLSRGSELYDSSFRNILVPVLKQEIKEKFANNLLRFLNKTDPANILVSNFIISLAQKGKLTTFFPENSKEQEHILDLVAESAFKDENGIILFSATFMHLLEVLEPEARSFLVKRMSELADEGTAAYSRLITVILQYYLEEFPELLGTGDRTRIVRLIVRHGAVKLHEYLATPFAEWKKDGRLTSLSIFHPDDDGRESFKSNAKILMKSGYNLALSGQFTIGTMTDKARKNVQGLIDAAVKNPGKGLPHLFNAMLNQRFAVSFIRSVNGLIINHANYVYSNEYSQESLLERFILSGTEMLAQRGHSYWRSDQITEPMKMLKEKGRLADNDLQAKQRFLSLGSCGGVKAYTLLNQIFLGHVDILATIGSGLAVINDPYNKSIFEVIAKHPSTITWKDMARSLAFIFKGGHGRDYLQPGSLPAILHKILEEEKTRAKGKRSRQNTQSRITISTHY